MRIAVVLAAVLGVSASAQMVVSTDAGKVEGGVAGSGVRQFLGLPYAAAPVGDLRWREPQPVVAWDGVREAKTFGHHCWQFGGYPDMVFRDAGPSEDCLTLNVWAPADAKGLPVMVWVHGGGFIGGGSSEPRQDGQWLAKRGVVVVTLNYRLGMFGFMTSPELAAESAHHASGNYGLMDQAAALAWVQRNAAAFGGDAKNVTVMGESAGSFSVSALMASPVSKGTFAKAIGESGAAFWSVSIPFRAKVEAEAHDVALVEKTLGTSKVSELRKIPAEALATNKALIPSAAFPPSIDGYFLADTLANIYARGEEAQVPLLAGWNKDEVRSGVTFAKVKPTVESFGVTAKKNFGERAGEFLKVYPGATDAEAMMSAGDFVSDRFIAFATWRWLEAHHDHATTYRYEFDLEAPADKFHPTGTGAFHSDDIEYVFGTLDSRQKVTVRPEDRAMSTVIQRYWTNFAKTGDPNGGTLPQWPVYKADDWMVMHLDQTSGAKKDDLRARYLFLDSVWMK